MALSAAFTGSWIRLEHCAWLGAGLIRKKPPSEASFGALPAGPSFSAARVCLSPVSQDEKKEDGSTVLLRVWWLEADSNCRPRDYETLALTT